MLRAILFASCLLALAGLSVSFFLPTSRLLGRSRKLGSLPTNRRRFSLIRTPSSRSTITLLATNKNPASLDGKSSARIRKTPDWYCQSDLLSKFPERMRELNPDRGGFPKIAESFTPETLDEAIEAEIQRCTAEKKPFQVRQVKILFVNEDGKEMLIPMIAVWNGDSQHPPDEMIEQWKKKMQEQIMNDQPKGGRDAAEREDAASYKLAALADAEIVLLEAYRLFDIAFPDSHPSGNVTYAQINVLDFQTKSGSVNSGKSIGKLKQYLRGGGAVFILVLLHGEIECAYVLLPTDLADFEKATKGMNESTTFQPYPFSKQAPWGGLSKIMSKYKVQARDLRAKVDEHKRTGPRKSQWYLDHDASQMSPAHFVEDQYLLVFNATFSGLGAKRIRHAPGDLLICGVSVEFKMANPHGRGFKIGIRRGNQPVTDFNEVRVYCIVFKNETDPQEYTFVFVPSLTSRGTCAFAPEGGYDGNRSAFCFYFDPTASPPFSAKAKQYDPSTLADMLVARSSTDIEAIKASLQLCRDDPPMSDAEKERVSYILPVRVKREQEVKRQGKSKKKQGRHKNVMASLSR